MNNKIISLYIEILSQCNERCTYCYNQNNINNTVLLDIKLTAYYHNKSDTL